MAGDSLEMSKVSSVQENARTTLASNTHDGTIPTLFKYRKFFVLLQHTNSLKSAGITLDLTGAHEARAQHEPGLAATR